MPNTIMDGGEWLRAARASTTPPTAVGVLPATALLAKAVDASKATLQPTSTTEVAMDCLLRQWNATHTEFPRDRTIHQLFEAQVACSAAAVAAVHGDERLTYAQLNAHANRLAHHLRELGVVPDSRVGICAQRGLPMVVGVLAILKAGGAYVPLDPSYPPQRLAYMIGDSAPVVLLIDLPQQERASLTAALSTSSATVLDLQADAHRWVHASEQNLSAAAVGLTAQHLSHVIYTSGSTGLPKGVAVEHCNVVNFICWSQRAFEPQELAETFFSTSLNFDLSVFELFVPLSLGRCVRVVKNALEIAALGAGGTLLNTVPAAITALLDVGGVPQSVRTVNLAGEPLRQHLVERIFAETAVESVCNLYGPTETTTYSTWVRMSRKHGFVSHIGRPIDNTQIYILDEQQQVVPIGTLGEVYIGGAGVARGYLNREALSAERFLRDPFSAEAAARMYRTGDVGRYLPDGSIEYLGRNDHQVKIRGYRIELGEIEARLLEHPDVRNAVVIAREDGTQAQRLVAYVTPAGSTLEVAALRKHVRALLPEYMTPAVYVVLESLPLTPNGKLDRMALPAPELHAHAAREYEAPRGEVESALARIWAEVLQLERVGRQDNFFELGGHSLLAAQIVARLREQLAVCVTLRELFARPCLADCAAALSGVERASPVMLTRVDRSQPLPLSRAQRGLWFLHRLHPGADRAYHLAFAWRLTGPLRRHALRWALDRLVERHEPLRTSFASRQDQPVQVIREFTHFDLCELDLSPMQSAEQQQAAQRQYASEIHRSFDFSAGPLIRGCLVCFAANVHELLIVQHHIISDGWSLGVWLQDLAALYNARVRDAAAPLSALPLQYADYAAWQHEDAQRTVIHRQLPFWREHLRDALPLLELPTDRPRPDVQSYRGERVTLSLDPELTAALHRFSREHAVTPFMTLLAAWSTLLSRLSGQQDIVIGTPVANRQQPQLERLIGFFVNTLALRVDLRGELRVRELVQRVKETALAAYEHQDVPFDQVVEAVRPVRNLGHNPLFQSMLALNNTPDLQGIALQDLSVSQVSVPRNSTHFDLSLLLDAGDAGLQGCIEYASDLFDRASVQRIAAYFAVLLRAMLADPAARVSRLPLLDAAELQRLLLQFNATAQPRIAELLVHQAFEAQVARSPAAIAVARGAEQLTYAQLNASANRLAHYLRGLGVAPDSRVGICAERSVQLVVGVLAVLKAGGAYVPLDPSYPPQRLAYMIEDSTPVALLIDLPQQERAALRAVLSTTAATVVELQADVSRWAEQSAQDVVPAAAGLTAKHLAYVMYTSGSTGQPKGVAIEHRNVVNLIGWGQQVFERHELAETFFSTSLNFDLSVFELFVPLSLGGCVRIAKHALEIATLGASGTLVNTVPSAISALVELGGVPQGVRTVNLCGEPLKKHVVEGIFATTAVESVCNLYGPTETTVYSTLVRMRRRDGFVPHIGRPIANTQIYILDEQQQVVPIGVVGEMYIGGAGVARGYLNREQLTAERFLRDPFNAQAEARMYRTGDLARYLADGSIEYLGRNDHQVKIRGHRIELGEIEARLLEHPSVRDVVVVAREEAGQERRLVAYVTRAVQGPEVTELGVESLREHVQATLPQYMTPAAYVVLERLPLTPNGKVDRKALPAPELQSYTAREYEAPRGEVETVLARVWAEVLELERVGRHDNFFELGGHSLLAVTLLERMRRVDLQVDVRAIFATPTLAALAGATAEVRELIL